MEPNETERLSRMLFCAREEISMWADVVERFGETADVQRRLIAEIDEYRAEQGWPAHGFGCTQRKDELMPQRLTLTITGETEQDVLDQIAAIAEVGMPSGPDGEDESDNAKITWRWDDLGEQPPAQT
jgi:hypothetical protein